MGSNLKATSFGKSIRVQTKKSSEVITPEDFLV